MLEVIPEKEPQLSNLLALSRIIRAIYEPSQYFLKKESWGR
ncbi:MAG: hypothetical protein AB8G15_20515 [Saprospiraceae bacterium]